MSSKGRGRVVPRSSAGSSRAPLLLPGGPPHLPLPAAAAVHHDQQQLQAVPPQQQPRWRCSPSAEGGPVQQLWPAALGGSGARTLLCADAPLLLPGHRLATCKLLAPPAAAARQQQPNDSAAPAEPLTQSHRTVPVLVSSADTNRFMPLDDPAKNAPGSYYHVRQPATGLQHMRFDEWLASWQAWRSSRLLLQVELASWQLSGAQEHVTVQPNPAVCPHVLQLLHPTMAASAVTAAAATSSSAAAESLIDWRALQRLLPEGQWATSGSLHLLAGGSDALLPARYAQQDRLFCQVSGRQRLLLLPPELAFAGLYPFPVAHPYDKCSAVDWEEPETDAWPAAAQVKGLVCELGPGDSLLVPAFWFVHAQLQQPACVALVLQLQRLPSRLLRPGALLLQLSRMVEVWLAAQVGAPNVRKWLLALADAREWQLLEPQLADTDGYKRLRVCHMVMQQLQQVLSLMPPGSARAALAAHAGASGTCAAAADAQDGGDGGACPHAATGASACGGPLECAARHMLAAMCVERLMPTLWLNEGVSDLLLLSHPPAFFVIEEDAEAARYPSLLRHRLLGQRPDWIVHAKQLAGTPHKARAPPPLLLLKAAAAAEGAV